jgi:hypothetical protein
MRHASLLLCLLGCSSDSSSAVDAPTTPSADAPTAPTADAPPTVDAAPGSPDAASTTPDGASAATFTLAIENYASWCTITEDGVAFSASKSFPSGHAVALHAAPIGGFFWGFWTGTDGDKTGAHDTAMTTMVTMTGDKSVFTCCPAANGGTCP